MNRVARLLSRIGVLKNDLDYHLIRTSMVIIFAFFGNQLQKVLEKKLAIDPEGYGLPLRGSLTGYWKHQFGNHRVVYRIYPQHHVVVVCSVGVRKQGDAEDICRQLESVAKTGRLAEQLAAVLRNLLPSKK